MKTINSFDDCLYYSIHIGVGKVQRNPGWIPYAQKKLCDFCDKLMAMSGNTTWYHKEFKPFKVHLDRKSQRVKVYYHGNGPYAGFVCKD
jgi:hypothetical protein